MQFRKFENSKYLRRYPKKRKSLPGSTSVDSTSVHQPCENNIHTESSNPTQTENKTQPTDIPVEEKRFLKPPSYLKEYIRN